MAGGVSLALWTMSLLAPAVVQVAEAAESRAADAARLETSAEAEPVDPRSLVLAADLAVSSVAVFPAPTLDASLFLGGGVPRVQRRRPRWTALGLRMIGSFGAVMFDSNLDSFHGGVRLHAAVVGAAGRRGGFAYAAGVGPVFAFVQRQAAHPGNPTPYGLDVEGRFGYWFRVEGSRVRPGFGGLLRVTVPLGGDDRRPMPMLGLYFGLALGPRER